MCRLFVLRLFVIKIEFWTSSCSRWMEKWARTYVIIWEIIGNILLEHSFADTRSKHPIDTSEFVGICFNVKQTAISGILFEWIEKIILFAENCFLSFSTTFLASTCLELRICSQVNNFHWTHCSFACHHRCTYWNNNNLFQQNTPGKKCKFHWKMTIYLVMCRTSRTRR